MSIPLITLNDGHQIPQLGLGVWQVRSNSIVPTVLTALEAGYRHIDTAAAYYNEEGVGRALKQSGIARDELFITTKLDNSDQGRARAALEDSLTKLGLDYIDLYLIHWPVPSSRDRLKAWKAMEQAQVEGLIRSIGVSNFTPRYLTEIINLGGTVPAVNQIEYHPTFQQTQLEDTNRYWGIATEAYSPLGMGSAPQNEQIKQIAKRVNKTPAQVILRWHLQAGRIIIPKSVRPSRIVENSAIADFTLTDSDIAAINGLHTGNYLGWNPEAVN